MVNWEVSKEDFDLITEITDRAVEIALRVRTIKAKEVGAFKLELRMDLTATHASGCPLRLANLLSAPSGDFAHDVFGIRQHIDRETGQLGECFLPRYAQPALARGEA